MDPAQVADRSGRSLGKLRWGRRRRGHWKSTVVYQAFPSALWAVPAPIVVKDARSIFAQCPGDAIQPEWAFVIAVDCAIEGAVVHAAATFWSPGLGNIP